jgi:hypothetical protein
VHGSVVSRATGVATNHRHVINTQRKRVVLSNGYYVILVKGMDENVIPLATTGQL